MDKENCTASSWDWDWDGMLFDNSNFAGTEDDWSKSDGSTSTGQDHIYGSSPPAQFAVKCRKRLGM